MKNETMSVKNHTYQLGNTEAAIVLVEYGDYECPHCAKAWALVQKLMEEFDDQLLFEFRNFPLREIHPMAMVGAQAAEAAGIQGKFWEMHNFLFRNQSRLSLDFTIYLADELELNLGQFLNDRDNSVVIEKIEHDLDTGEQIGIDRTPAFLINNMRLNSYDETYDSLYKALISGDSA